jgi:hypothetical protein
LIIGILSVAIGGLYLVVQSLGILNFRERMQVWAVVSYPVVEWGNLILQFVLAIVLIHVGVKLLRMQPTARRDGITAAITIIVAQLGFITNNCISNLMSHPVKAPVKSY